MNSFKEPLESLKKLREELHDSLDKSKRDELDNIIDAFKQNNRTQDEKLELLDKAVKLLPAILKMLEFFQ